MNISHDGEYATAVCLSHEDTTNDAAAVVRRVSAVGPSAEVLKELKEKEILIEIKKEQKHYKRLALELERVRKLREWEGLMQRLEQLEEKVARQEEKTGFVQRNFTTPETKKSKRVARTIFVGNIHPKTTISDLESMFAEFSNYVKAYLYTNDKGHLLGTGAIILERPEDADNARVLKDGSDLHGNIIRCLPWMQQSLRKFTQKGIHRDDVFMKEQQNLKNHVTSLKQELDLKTEPGPKPLLDPMPLPKASDPQYILVRELFRIQDDYHNRRARGIQVSGLNTEVTENDLRQHFKGISENVTVSIQLKNGRSSGRAIVLFETVEQAVLALETMNETLLLGTEMTCKELSAGKRWNF